MSVESRLAGKVAVVTGGAGGIGRTVVRRLAAEGAQVVVADINGEGAEALARDIGSAASAVQFDAEQIVDVERMIRTAVERHGRLDILHNNAAFLAPETLADTTVVDTPVELWDRVMTINLRSYFLACKHAIPHMVEGGGGSIIQMSSSSGLVGSNAFTAYGVSKAGVIGLTRYVAAQYGHRGVRCNTIAPGMIVTPDNEIPLRELIQQVEPHLLTTRMGNPDDIAALVAYLASDESGYVTAQTLQVGGGWLDAAPYLANALGKELGA